MGAAASRRSALEPHLNFRTWRFADVGQHSQLIGSPPAAVSATDELLVVAVRELHPARASLAWFEAVLGGRHDVRSMKRGAGA
jgi:hypothetical protein